MSPLSTFAAACACALFAQCIQAAPYIPANGSDVIERLPRSSELAKQELKLQRARLTTNPNDVAMAVKVARHHIATARRETDPRHFGYAQAALAPWWSQADPPLEVRLLRATLLQSTHHFPEAMRDLDAVVKVDPANAQAWLTRATVQTVRGDYDGATASCAKLSLITTQLVSTACIASIGAMTGRAAASASLLEMTLRRNSDASAELQVWALTLLGEIAERRGDAVSAESLYKRALALDPDDSYLIGAFADFLLDQQRAAEVVGLLQDRTRIDGLLLRYALALRQMPGAGADLRRADAELRARFNAAMRRGDTVHQREQARYELHVRGDSKTALALAKQNWAVQKESADLRVLLEAALKLGDRASATPALEWAAKIGLEDVNVQRLARQLKAGA
jgi:tetratricopeptide (TPR) repeat protein